MELKFQSPSRICSNCIYLQIKESITHIYVLESHTSPLCLSHQERDTQGLRPNLSQSQNTWIQNSSLSHLSLLFNFIKPIFYNFYNCNEVKYILLSFTGSFMLCFLVLHFYHYSKKFG